MQLKCDSTLFRNTSTPVHYSSEDNSKSFSLSPLEVQCKPFSKVYNLFFSLSLYCIVQEAFCQ